MTHPPIARYAYPASVGLLAGAICLVGAFVLGTVAPELGRLAGDASATPSPTASPSATPSASSPMALAPNGVAMSPDADCGACHLDSAGAVGTKPIPVLAHPLEGWRDCTACHADDRLVQTAPGHSGLHKSDCLACHKVPDAEGTAPPRPHHLVTGAACVSCHGTEAPLPTDMTGRTNCWICHGGEEFDDLFFEPAPTAPSVPSLQPGG